jgi:hypothetical protein
MVKYNQPIKCIVGSHVKASTRLRRISTIRNELESIQKQKIMACQISTTSDVHLSSIIRENNDKHECCICLCDK